MFFHHLRKYATDDLRGWRNEENKHEAKKMQSLMERMFPSILTESGTYIVELKFSVDLRNSNTSILEGIRRELTKVRRKLATSAKNEKRHRLNPWLLWNLLQVPGGNPLRIAKFLFKLRGNPSYDPQANKRNAQVQRALKKAKSMIATVAQRYDNLSTKGAIADIARLENLLAVVQFWGTVPHKAIYRYCLPRNHSRAEIQRVARNHKATCNRAPDQLVPYDVD